MEEQIDILKEELNSLIKDDICLYSDEIVKLSQELDILICDYYILHKL